MGVRSYVMHGSANVKLMIASESKTPTMESCYFGGDDGGCTKLTELILGGSRGLCLCLGFLHLILGLQIG
jgi:hypothetical protein